MQRIKPVLWLAVCMKRRVHRHRPWSKSVLIQLDHKMDVCNIQYINTSGSKYDGFLTFVYQWMNNECPSPKHTLEPKNIIHNTTHCLCHSKLRKQI